MRKVFAYCSFLSLFAVCLLFLSRNGATAQNSTQTPSATAPSTTTPSKTPPKRETNAKPMTEKEKKKQEEKLRKELASPYKKWLDEEVYWIITPDERTAFNKLNTDEEREAFIENFWLKRDPTPGTERNEYEEEYYRRIAYANENFASVAPGWKTDRGMVYIKYGPPDEREEHPTGGTYERPIAEGGGTTAISPFEKWRYRYIPGLGDVTLEFVDDSRTGEYHLVADRETLRVIQQMPSDAPALQNAK